MVELEYARRDVAVYRDEGDDVVEPGLQAERQHAHGARRYDPSDRQVRWQSIRGKTELTLNGRPRSDKTGAASSQNATVRIWL